MLLERLFISLALSHLHTPASLLAPWKPGGAKAAPVNTLQIRKPGWWMMHEVDTFSKPTMLFFSFYTVHKEEWQTWLASFYDNRIKLSWQKGTDIAALAALVAGCACLLSRTCINWGLKAICRCKLGVKCLSQNHIKHFCVGRERGPQAEVQGGDDTTMPRGHAFEVLYSIRLIFHALRRSFLRGTLMQLPVTFFFLILRT